jgi:hypothetical protein
VQLICNGPVEAKGKHHAITIHITDNDLDAVQHTAQRRRKITQRYTLVEKSGWI